MRRSLVTQSMTAKAMKKANKSHQNKPQLIRPSSVHMRPDAHVIRIDIHKRAAFSQYLSRFPHQRTGFDCLHSIDASELGPTAEIFARLGCPTPRVDRRRSRECRRTLASLDTGVNPTVVSPGAIWGSSNGLSFYVR